MKDVAHSYIEDLIPRKSLLLVKDQVLYVHTYRTEKLLGTGISLSRDKK